MEKIFDVFRKDQPVGTVTLTPKGLYYQIYCNCTLPQDSMVRLYAAADHGTQMLGLLFPEGDRFALRTQVPIQKLGQGSIRFYVGGQDEQERRIFLDSCQPFMELQALEHCRFAVIDDKPCLVMCEEK